jgi:hypothetical protein
MSKRKRVRLVEVLGELRIRSKVISKPSLN